MKIKISETKKGEVGKIEVEYYTNSDFERIVDLILDLE